MEGLDPDSYFEMPDVKSMIFYPMSGLVQAICFGETTTFVGL